MCIIFPDSRRTGGGWVSFGFCTDTVYFTDITDVQKMGTDDAQGSFNHMPGTEPSLFGLCTNYANL